MFAKIWIWLANNRHSLTGLAALITAVALLRPVLVPIFFPPDLIVRYSRDPSTVPDDLMKWAQKLGFEILVKGTVPEGLDSLKNSDVIQKLENNLRGDGIDRFSITLTNTSANEIPHVRVSVDGCASLWSSQIDGTYITADEAKSFASNSKLADSSRLVLPELPPLPPNSSTTIRLYGRFPTYATLDIASTVRTQVVELVVIESNWWFRHRYELQGAFWGLGGILLFAALSFAVSRVMERLGS
jgi:hypothetical protein